jgi:cobalt-zinc-cadmium efflux system outer membrane protein
MSRRSGRVSGVIKTSRPVAIVTLTLTLTFLPSASPRAAEETRAAGPAVPLALSIDEAAKRAAEASAIVRRARAQRTATEARRVEAGMMLPSNPVIAGSVGPTRLSVPGAPTRSELGMAGHVEQTVEIAGQRGTRLAEVDRAVEGARLREGVADVEARARGRATYVAALLAAAQLEGARRLEELATQLETSVKTRVSTGAASDIDLSLATLERSRIQRDRYEFVQAAAESLAELRTLLALAPETPIRLTTPLAAPTAATPALAYALARAETHRAELLALDAQRAELDAAITRLRREAVPSPTIFLDVERDRPGEMFVRAGLAIPLPVWRRNQGPIAVARAQRSQVEVERDVGAREVALEVERAWHAATTRRAQVELDQKEVVPSAETALDLLTQGWRAGKFDLFRIIQASRESGDARRRALANLGRLWEAHIELDRAMGTP